MEGGIWRAMGPKCCSSRDSTQFGTVGEFDSGRMATRSSVSSSRALTVLLLPGFREWKMNATLRAEDLSEVGIHSVSLWY